MPIPMRCVYLAVLTLVGVGVGASAGPLDPPPGPIMSTLKPLSEVEPRTAINAANTPGTASSLFRITQPGSYYLTGNVTGVTGKSGIEIASSGVTVDLNGFELTGVPGAFNGVNVFVSSLFNIEVRNGSIRAWPNFGINFATFNAFASVVRDVRCSDNGTFGIAVGWNSAVIDCIASSNGIHGISAAKGSVVSRCLTFLNGGDGIDAGNSSVVEACASLQNSGNGIAATFGATISRCTTEDNADSGFSVSSDCTIIGCTAFSNDAHGIAVAGGCTVSDNACRSNGLDGIMVGSGCIVIANTCSSNGVAAATGAGIHVTSSDNRIEGNNCVGQDRGVDVDFAGNIIIRNTCSGNALNWDIVANNVYGPIINRTAPASPAVAGNSAASTLGSTDANANYSY